AVASRRAWTRAGEAGFVSSVPPSVSERRERLGFAPLAAVVPAPDPRPPPIRRPCWQDPSSMIESNETYLTVAEVAELLKLNQQTIRNWIDRGELPAIRVGSRRVRIRQSDLDEALTAASE